ncbi:MAG: ABC transporter substrate-binding protein [Chloroflexi bacterium]|nr:ABC transporter substrate-binding protein [Chloroflexota bacterium]
MQHKWHRMSYIVAMLTLLLLTACGGTSTGPTTGGSSSNSNPGVLDPNKKYTVNFWEVFATGANKTTLEALTKQYMQAHSNVTINLQPYDSYDTLQTKLTAAIAAGKPPALAQVYEEWANQYQQSNAIVSLQPFMTGKNGFSQTDLSDFYPTLLKDGQIDGTQYMLPFNKSDIVLYYNANLLQKLGITAPTTIQNFVSALNKATNGSQWGLSYTPDVDGWSILYKALGGGDFVSQDGKTAVFANDTNKQYATEALGILAPLVKSGAIHLTKLYDWQNDFISQKSVFAISTTASYGFLAKPIGNAFKFNEAPVPGGPAGQYTVLFGSNLSIFSGADADSQSAAWDYVKFLTSTDANATFVKQTGYMPVRQSTFNSPALQDYYSKVPALKVGPQLINKSFVASAAPGWTQCRNIITTAFTSVLSGQSTADAAMTKMSQDCNSALAQS